VILWLDAQISPRLCPWIAHRFSLEAVHVRDIDLREAEDSEIFNRARRAGVIMCTKDEDFVELVRRLSPPPQVLWLRCGNMSNTRLKDLLARTLPDAIDLLRQGEPIVEVGFAEGDRGGRTARSSRPRPRGRSGKAASRSGSGG
jgi:predicted nuclease of predicted toxin-antitoxin system